MGFNMKSKQDGSCKGDTKHSWKTGDSLFADKKSDGTWVICIDEACYKKLGGTEIQQKSFPQKKVRTIEERMMEAKQMIEFCWNTSWKKTEDFSKIITVPLDSREKLILAQVFYKGLVEDWIR